MKKSILFLSSLFSLSSWCMQEPIKVDETPYSVKQDAQAMVALCKDKCSFSRDVLQACTDKCFKDYGKQYEYFLVRKYTCKCAGTSFTETWSYKTDIKEHISDVLETSEAYTKWENPSIKKCAQGHLAEVNRIIQSAIRVDKNKLEQAEEEHPYISKAINIINSIRRK